jgi:hypothetical protein
MTSTLYTARLRIRQAGYHKWDLGNWICAATRKIWRTWEHFESIYLCHYIFPQCSVLTTAEGLNRRIPRGQEYMLNRKKNTQIVVHRNSRGIRLSIYMNIYCLNRTNARILPYLSSLARVLLLQGLLLLPAGVEYGHCGGLQCWLAREMPGTTRGAISRCYPPQLRRRLYERGLCLETIGQC